MKTTDGRDKYILDKQGDETDAKHRQVTLQVTPILGKNIKESQQTEPTPVSVKRGYDNA